MARKYDLTQEQLDERKRNFDESAGLDGVGAGGDSSDLFLKWNRGAKTAEVEVLWHQAMKMTERISFRLPLATVLPARDDLPERTALFFNKWTSHESPAWHRKLRIDKAPPSDPKCPMMRLLFYVDQHIGKLGGEVLFRFGQGCTDKDGKPSPITEITGDDLLGHSDNWKKKINPQQSRLLVVVPVSGTTDGKAVTYEPKAVIAEETRSLGQAFLDEIENAVKDHGTDVADPIYAAAVYRWTYDNSARDKYGCRFSLRGTEDLSDAAYEAGNAPIPQELRDKATELLTPGDPQRLLTGLQTALAFDLDLPTILGIKPGEAAPSAPAANGARKPRRAAKAATPAPDPNAEPCPECGTPWPDGVRRCPGNATAKKCDMVDENVAEDAVPF